MKKYLVILLAIILIGCGKDGGLGPAGPTGATGATGSAGQNGLNGTNALNNIKTYVVDSFPANQRITVDTVDMVKPPLFIAYQYDTASGCWIQAGIFQIYPTFISVSATTGRKVIMYQITSLE